MMFHYEVTVTTVTDVDDDVAVSEPVRVATHVPGNGSIFGDFMASSIYVELQRT